MPMTQSTVVLLASQSPRRLELLRQLGLQPRVQPVQIDETPRPGEAATEYVLRLARAKAEAAVSAAGHGAGVPIVAADTAVAVDGVILGKPENAAAAHHMLRLLSGRTHEVHTAVAVATRQALATAVSTSRVTMMPLPDDDIAAYLASGEAYDKAGAYGIQGLAGMFVQRLEGSYSGVMGLPLFETAQLLRAAGVGLLRHE